MARITSIACGVLLPNLPRQSEALQALTCVGLLNSAIPGALISRSHTSLPGDSIYSPLCIKARLTHTQNISSSASVKVYQQNCMYLSQSFIVHTLSHAHIHTHTVIIAYCGLTALHRSVSVFP